MYPFFVLDLPHDCTDQDVEDRYHALLLRFPPDVAPDQFTLIRAAYEALRDERQRLSTRLFYHDDDTQIVESLATVATLQERPRLSPDALAEWLRTFDD